jgi:drug/metabolite transporter (DMT)-like permease
VTRKALLLFILTSAIWGSSFLFVGGRDPHRDRPAVHRAGAATASVITYVMPVVALFLGVGILGEKLTAGAIAGLALIALGAWLATARRSPGAAAPDP